jgi:hypothetical protein
MLLKKSAKSEAWRLFGTSEGYCAAQLGIAVSSANLEVRQFI